MSVFRFKQFDIDQSGVAMKVGTDGVLLGAWAGVEHEASKALDIGTGTGLIALQLAQRFKGLELTAVEWDAEAAFQAKVNASNSLFTQRITVVEADVLLWYHQHRGCFDAVVTNPPYFDESPLTEYNARHIARQSVYLPLEALIHAAAFVLRDGGSLSIIIPFERAEALRVIAKNQGFQLRRYCLVKGRKETQVRRVLFDWVKTEKALVVIREELVLEIDRNLYTEEYRALTAPFYLNF
jgi:tRNA1Val (adenine37-N6)-methyltransferase